MAGFSFIQSVTTIFDVPSSSLNWLVELMCMVFDILTGIEVCFESSDAIRR